MAITTGETIVQMQTEETTQQGEHISGDNIVALGQIVTAYEVLATPEGDLVWEDGPEGPRMESRHATQFFTPRQGGGGRQDPDSQRYD